MGPSENSGPPESPPRVMPVCGAEKTLSQRAAQPPSEAASAVQSAAVLSCHPYDEPDRRAPLLASSASA